MSSFYVALSPWLVFIVSDRSRGVGPAGSAGGALAVAVAVLAYERSRSGPSMIAGTAVVLFAALCGLAIAIGSDARVWSYDRGFAVAVLAALLLVSCAATPVTMAYSDTEIAHPRRDSLSHRRMNLSMTRFWSLTFALVAASLVFGATFADAAATTLFNWLVPIVIVTATAVRLAPRADDGATLALGALNILRSPGSDTLGPAGESVPQ